MIQTPVFLSIEKHVLMPEQLKNSHERAGPSTSLDIPFILGPLPGTAVYSLSLDSPASPSGPWSSLPGLSEGLAASGWPGWPHTLARPPWNMDLSLKQNFSYLFTSLQNSIKVKTKGGRTEAEAKAQSPDESAWATMVRAFLRNKKKVGCRAVQGTYLAHGS